MKKALRLIILISVLNLNFSCGKIKNAESQMSLELQKNESDSLNLKGIKEIPSNVFNKINLTYLSVYGQDCDVMGIECLAIDRLPSEISKLTNLEILRLPLNYIEQLPKEILELKNLKVIDLTDNPHFSDLETVGKIKWLKEFYCYGCNLSKTEVNKLKNELPNCIIETE